ncbi:MAG: aspartate/glutamate racemase family protein [Azospirillaceae bacterium]
MQDTAPQGTVPPGTVPLGTTPPAPDDPAAPWSAARPVGIIMLDTHFPRPHGDIGNPATFGGHALIRRVPAATVASVVRSGALDPAVAVPIADAARELAAAGAAVIATSCGFLGSLQDRLAAAVDVPVIASALNRLPDIRASHGAAARLGILTFDAATLTPAHFGGNHDPRDAVAGVEAGRELARVIRGDLPELDIAAAEADAVDAARRLVAAAPDIAAIVLECTNLGPYRTAIARATGLPVHDLVGLIAETLAAGKEAAGKTAAGKKAAGR